MKAANYRNTAEAWRNLARDSWLRFQFQSGDQADENAPTQSRAWYATADSAPVVFTMQSQSLDLSPRRRHGDGRGRIPRRPRRSALVADVEAAPSACPGERLAGRCQPTLFWCIPLWCIPLWYIPLLRFWLL